MQSVESPQANGRSNKGEAERYIELTFLQKEAPIPHVKAFSQSLASKIPSSDPPNGRPSDAYRQPDLAGRLAHPESNLLRDTFRIGIGTE